MNPDEQNPTPSTNNDPVQSGVSGVNEPAGGSYTSQAPTGSTPAPQPGVGAPVSPQSSPFETPPAAGPAPTQPFAGGDVSSSPLPPASGGPSKKLLVIIIVSVVLIAGLAVGGYFFFKNKNHKDQAKNANKVLQESSQNRTSDTVDISQLNNVTFSIPDSALAGLQEAPTTGNPNAKLYATNDGKCVVAWGTATPAILPGKDISEIVAKYLDTIRQAGAQVSTPVAAPARTFQADDGSEYSIPSLKFDFTQGSIKAKGYYSAAVLKSGTRVIAETACQTTSGEVDDAMMANIEKVVEQLRIKVEP